MPASGRAGKSTVIALLLVVIGALVFTLKRAAPPSDERPAPALVPTVALPRGTAVTVSHSATTATATVATKAPEQPATATFDFHGTRPGYQSSFYVLGEVTNTSPFAIRKPEVITVLLDATGKEVGTDSGFATKDILEPSEKSYVNAIISDPPPHQSLKFEVVAHRATFRPSFAEHLRIVDSSSTSPHPNQYKFTGKIANEGQRAARFVHVEVFAFDAGNKLLGVASSYAKTDRLEPGSSARYQVTSLGYVTTPARFETTVTARVAD